MLPSTVPRTFTDFALMSPRMDACSSMVSVPLELIGPLTSQSITSSLRKLTEPLIETPLEIRPTDCAGADERFGCSGIAGISGSGFRVKNIAIYTFASSIFAVCKANLLPHRNRKTGIRQGQQNAREFFNLQSLCN